MGEYAVFPSQPYPNCKSSKFKSLTLQPGDVLCLSNHKLGWLWTRNRKFIITLERYTKL